MPRALAFAITLLICNPGYAFTKEELQNMPEEEVMALDAFEIMSVAFDSEGKPVSQLPQYVVPEHCRVLPAQRQVE